MRFFREWVLHNWSLKLLALLIAFSLWATYNTDPVAEVGLTVPIEFVNVSPRLEIAGDVPTVVHLRVRGHAALLRRLTPGDLGVTLDLSGDGLGVTNVHLRPRDVDAPYGAQIVRIEPSEIHVHLVSRASP